MKYSLIILFAVVSLNVNSQTDNKYIRKGNSSYRDGNFAQAEVEYRRALEKNPESYKADFNLGNSLYKQKQYDAAAGRYSSLIKSFDPSFSAQPEVSPTSNSSSASSVTPASPGVAKSAAKNLDREVTDETLSNYYYNLGNTLFRCEKYKESIEAYKNALRRNPSDMDAKHNLQLALRMLTEQQQQQQGNKQQNDNQQNNRQNKDQQNQDQQNQNQQNDPNQNQQNSQQQQRKGEISPEDAERILQALENQEKETMKQIQERKERSRKIPVEKNW